MRGIYLHIPFCARKCRYCDFYSVEVSPDAAEEFRGLLVAEMQVVRDRRPEESAAAVDTVYFGGGTPTTLAPQALRGLVEAVRARFPVVRSAEVTAEANPGTVSGEDLSVLRDAGFNRLSIGVQSFRPALLRTLGRIHGAAAVLRTFRDARAAGFDSIGFDLIFGIPGQEPADWERDLERTIALGPDHISVYALTPEPGTPLHAAIRRGDSSPPPDDEIAQMYGAARRILSGAGYRQYEISNFARPGHECRHNAKYWRREETLGLGPAAHGLLFPPRIAPHGLRTANPASLEEYRRRISDGLPPWVDERICGREDAWKESLFLGLRMTDGVDLAKIEATLGPPPSDLLETLAELGRTRRLIRTGSRLRLPERLLFVSNEVFALLA